MSSLHLKLRSVVCIFSKFRNLILKFLDRDEAKKAEEREYSPNEYYLGHMHNGSGREVAARTRRMN
jgi:hypothetical protein